MRSRLPALVLGLGLIAAPPGAEALDVKGYKPEAGHLTHSFTGRIERIEETPTDFVLAIQSYASFYVFPRQTTGEENVRSFLKRRSAAGIELLFHVDPLTLKILEIRDPPRDRGRRRFSR